MKNTNYKQIDEILDKLKNLIYKMEIQEISIEAVNNMTIHFPDLLIDYHDELRKGYRNETQFLKQQFNDLLQLLKSNNP